MTDYKHCRVCHEPVPKIVIYTLNKIAAEKGFCSWFCLSLQLGYAKAMKIIKEYRIETMQATTGLDSQGKPHQNASKGRTRSKRYRLV